MQDYYQPTPTGQCVSAMKKSGKLGLAVVIVILGVVLLFWGNRRGDEETPPAATTTPTREEAHTVDQYRLALETRMAHICSEVAGAGDVSVVVTLAGGYEYVYAYDVKTTVGGESTSYITVGSGDNEQLVYITQRAPAITGIGVVCDGGLDPRVRQEITGLLSAAFDVGSQKIYVTGRK